MGMMEMILFALIALFLLIYILKALLLVGYNHYKYKTKNAGAMLSELLTIMFTLKPLAQKRLEPKGYDYKLYERFQKKNIIYYTVLWIFLFLILFLVAKIYLELF